MKFLTALLAVAALVAGCGGSSGGGSSTSSSTAAGSGATVASTSSSPATTSASSPAPTFASSSNCQALADMGRKYVAEIQAGGGNADWGTLLKADQAMADASPSGIHSDAEYVVHTFAGFVSAMSKAGFKPGSVPTASQIAALAPLENQLKSAQFVGAVDHIKAWITSNCHGVS